jgi:Uma2 family endonuclease
MTSGVSLIDEDVGEFNIPTWVKDLKSFRKWMDEDEELDFGRVGYLKGVVWVDMSREQLYTHNAVKTELASVLHQLVKRERLGRYFVDGALVVNVPADVGNQPDGAFVSFDAFNTGRVIEVPSRRDGGYGELEGTPDLVIEVVSRSSVKKDFVRLRKAYWEAGITEYWLIDARKEPVTFEILRTTARGYVTTRKAEGWAKSAVFGRSFMLTAGVDERGRPEFTLEVR